jgi:hypothetical protein
VARARACKGSRVSEASNPRTGVDKDYLAGTHAIREGRKEVLRLVVDVVMLDGGVRRRAVPQRNRTLRVGTEPHASDRFTNEIGNTVARLPATSCNASSSSSRR